MTNIADSCRKSRKSPFVNGKIHYKSISDHFHTFSIAMLVIPEGIFPVSQHLHVLFQWHHVPPRHCDQKVPFSRFSSADFLMPTTSSAEMSRWDRKESQKKYAPMHPMLQWHRVLITAITGKLATHGKGASLFHVVSWMWTAYDHKKNPCFPETPQPLSVGSGHSLCLWHHAGNAAVP